LRTIAHVDLDAFYAQCEMVRLGVAEDQPLAVQQWQGLIAINYPARKFGLGRHITSTEAKKLCPNIILQHVATWREGDEKWAYHEDAFKHIATHKVSLDPYRSESKKIISLIKDTLPPVPLQRVEKAGIDEVFLDLSAQVHAVMLGRFPELKRLPPSDDLTEHLPLPSTTALDWDTDAVVDLNATTTEEEEDPDWDDVALSIAAEIVRHVRKTMRKELKYTSSGGIACNKMLAKLGSGYTKPNAQTVIRNRAVQHFLSGYKFTKIRNLGGKLGDEAVTMFNTDTVKDLLEVPLEQLQKLGDDTGAWLYKTIRGEDHSEVNLRTQIKSMLSAKSFRPSVNTFEQAVRWLRIFAADIFSRCVEEGVLENKRKPKSINLHHRQGGQMRSRQAPIPQGKTLTEDILFDLAKNLLAHIVVDGRAWPCANLSLSIAGFEDGVTGNKAISGFLVRGDEAKAMADRVSNKHPLPSFDAPKEKKRKSGHEGIQRFFTNKEESPGSLDDDADLSLERVKKSLAVDKADLSLERVKKSPAVEDADLSQERVKKSLAVNDSPPPSNQEVFNPHQTLIDTYFCKLCESEVPTSEQAEHQDWHFATELDRELRTQDQSPPLDKHQKPASKSVKLSAPSRGRPASHDNSSSKNVEKGQSRLMFRR
jgi:DNA polymerase eta